MGSDTHTALLDGCGAPQYASVSASVPPERGHFGNPYLRFTILFAALVVAISTLPVYLPAITPKYASIILGGISMLLAVQWFVVALCAARNYRRLNYVPLPTMANAVQVRQRLFRHVVIVPCYLDPLDVLLCCIDTLAAQQDPKNLLVVVTLERRTPELELKMASVQERFADSFGTLLVVVHDLNKSFEIPGGCSNKNFALREAYKHLVDVEDVDLRQTRVTLTTCDTDSKFHPNYFKVLEAAYLERAPRETDPAPLVVFQPPVFYNWNLDERPFFNRVTCIMRSMMMLGGLIAFNLNPMSIFSYPLELGYKAGFINPRYGVDDIIAKVRWMCDTASAVPVVLLPVPAISGPTIGTSFMLEVTEWGRQIRRWIVGASESFHYFIIHFKGTPMLSGLTWFVTFFNYYAVLLCSAGVFNLLLCLPIPQETIDIPLGIDGLTLSSRYLGLVALGLQMIAFGIGFVIDGCFTRHEGIMESIGLARNVLHWLTAPVVLLVYSLIAFISIVRFVFEGKKMAGHDMAAKDGFRVDPATPIPVVAPGHVAVSINEEPKSNDSPPVPSC